MDGVLQHDGFLDQIMEMVQTIVDTMGMNDWSKVTNLLLGQMPAEGHFTDETPPMKHQTCAPVISSPQFPMPEGHTRIIDGSTQEHETRDQIIKTVQIIADATGTNFWNPRGHSNKTTLPLHGSSKRLIRHIPSKEITSSGQL
jgi:hypothetical protein